MKTRTKRGLIILGGLAALGVASALVLNAFQDNLVFIFSPSQVTTHEAPVNRSFRLGGLVEEGSVKRSSDSLAVHFVVTDGAQTIPVVYNGLLPDMFREGRAWWHRASSTRMAYSARTRCWRSTTKTTLRRKWLTR